MTKKVEFFKHNLKQSDIFKINKVIKSNILTTGKCADSVQKLLSSFFNVKYSLLTNSWTNGAVATLLAMGIKKNDEIIIPAMTFIACANVIELLSAKPILVDVDEKTLMISEEQILKKINKKTKAIMIVNLYGNMIDIKKLTNAIKRKTKNKIFIIEDAAHSFESKLHGHNVGRFSDVTIFSFYATKNITTAEGGAIITNNAGLYKKLLMTISHGISKNFTKRFYNKNYNHYQMNILGTKANMPDVLASLIPDQLKKVYYLRDKREEIYNYYKKKLKNSSINFPEFTKGCSPGYHLFPIFVNPKIRDKILFFLNKNLIGCTVNYTSVTKFNYYRKKYKFNSNQFKNSENWGSGTLSLPFYPRINREEQDYVIKKVLEGLKKYE